MPRRHEYFSLDEANALVPTLEYYFRQLSLVQRDMVGVQRTLCEQGAEIGSAGVRLPRFAGAALRGTRDRYLRLGREYDQIIEEIIGLGVEIVDPETGVVNFYTWCDGEEIVLSWQYGEPSVHYWFDPGEQFPDRHPIRQLIDDAPGPRAVRH